MNSAGVPRIRETLHRYSFLERLERVNMRQIYTAAPHNPSPAPFSRSAEPSDSPPRASRYGLVSTGLPPSVRSPRRGDCFALTLYHFPTVFPASLRIGSRHNLSTGVCHDA